MSQVLIYLPSFFDAVQRAVCRGGTGRGNGAAHDQGEFEFDSQAVVIQRQHAAFDGAAGGDSIGVGCGWTAGLSYVGLVATNIGNHCGPALGFPADGVPVFNNREFEIGIEVARGRPIGAYSIGFARSDKRAVPIRTATHETKTDEQEAEMFHSAQ